MTGTRRRLAAAATLLLAACGTPGPRPVDLDREQCEYCRMQVTDARFAAEAITRTGRIHVFDSVECMASYVRGSEPGTIATVWVTDAAAPGTFVPAADATYLLDSAMRGPMGRAVAFATADGAREAQRTVGGTLARWPAILDDSAHVHGAP